MRRSLRLSLMLTMAVAMVIGVGGWWLRQAPPLPSGFAAIKPGMTPAQIESLLGQQLVEHESCLGGSYSLTLTRPECGLVTCIDITTNRHVHDQQAGRIRDLPRSAETCRAINVYHWSRINWLNHSDWIRTSLLGLSDS